MDRRRFLRNSILAGLSSPALLSLAESLANTSPVPVGGYDLIAVKGGTPAAMLDKGMNAFGGIKSVVKKNQTVVIKPNIGWDVVPEKAANTNPQLVSRLIEQCYSAGAKDVFVFDNTCDTWSKCYKNSGIEKAVKDAGGKIAPGNSEGYYQEQVIKAGKSLKNAKVHELMLSADVFINVPILKSHGSTQLTMSMKNLMGTVWDRRYWHKNDLHQCIADFATFRKPDLTIIDAYAVMKQNGPRGVSEADVTIMKSLIISRDMVLADAAAAKLFGSDPDSIGYIRIAHDMKVGSKNLSAANIQRISM